MSLRRIEVSTSRRLDVVDTRGGTPRLSFIDSLSEMTLASVRAAELNDGYDSKTVDAADLTRRTMTLVIRDSQELVAARSKILPPMAGMVEPGNDPTNMCLMFANLSRVDKGNYWFNELPGGAFKAGTLFSILPPYQASWNFSGATNYAEFRTYMRDKVLLPALNGLGLGRQSWAVHGMHIGRDGTLPADGPTPARLASELRELPEPEDAITVKLLIRFRVNSSGYLNGTTQVVFGVSAYLPKRLAPWLRTIDNLDYEGTDTFAATAAINGANPSWFTDDAFTYVRFRVHSHLLELARAGLTLDPGLFATGARLERVRLEDERSTSTSEAVQRSTLGYDVVKPSSYVKVDEPLFGSVGLGFIYGQAIGGFEFARYAYLRGAVSTDGGGLKIDATLKALWFDGKLLAAINPGVEGVNEAKLKMMDVLACNYSTALSVGRDPLLRTDLYRRALEGGAEVVEDVKKTVISAAEDGRPEVTMWSASLKCNDVKPSYQWFYYRVSPEFVNDEFRWVTATSSWQRYDEVAGVYVDCPADDALAGYLAGASFTGISDSSLQTVMTGIAGKTVTRGSKPIDAGEFDEGALFANATFDRRTWRDNEVAARDLLQFCANRRNTADLVAAAQTYGQLAKERYEIAK